MITQSLFMGAHMSVENWDEIRTAYFVAKKGTVSGAAEHLGVHHATVIRHIDALEARLGVKLFQRHARGYTPTEAGQELLRVASATDDQLTQLVGRIQGQESEIRGALNITSVAGMHSFIVPALAPLQRAHPDLIVNLMSDQRLYRLEYGEAHLAVRAGRRPTEPDNVVQHLLQLPVRLCAHESYVESYGLPAGGDAFDGHRFVNSPGDARPPANRWLEAHVRPEQVIFRANDLRAQETAVQEGLGIGFVSGVGELAKRGLVEVMPADPDWFADIWLVTHVDLHRTVKVQKALEAIKLYVRQVVEPEIRKCRAR